MAKSQCCWGWGGERGKWIDQGHVWPRGSRHHLTMGRTSVSSFTLLLPSTVPYPCELYENKVPWIHPGLTKRNDNWIGGKRLQKQTVKYSGAGETHKRTDESPCNMINDPSKHMGRSAEIKIVEIMNVSIIVNDFFCPVDSRLPRDRNGLDLREICASGAFGGEEMARMNARRRRESADSGDAHGTAVGRGGGGDGEERENRTDLLSCLLYTSPSPRDRQKSRMPSSA